MIINSCPLVGQDSFFSPHSSVCSYLYNELILRPMPQSVLKSKLSECFKNILILFFAVTKEKKPKNWEKRSVVTTPICRQEKTCSEGSSLFVWWYRLFFWMFQQSSWTLKNFFPQVPIPEARSSLVLHPLSNTGILLMPVFEKMFPVYTANVTKVKGNGLLEQSPSWPRPKELFYVPSGWFRLIALYSFLLLSHFPYSATTGGLRLIYTADGKKKKRLIWIFTYG